jgi:uncharacterized protein with GYD domain
MWFITLAKFRQSPTKEMADKMTEYFSTAGKWNVKIHNAFWTLGRFDAVIISEAPDEKTAMSFALGGPTGFASTETLVAVSREEAIKMLK